MMNVEVNNSPHQFIMAKDVSGRLYAYGTTPNMDKTEEYNRFKYHDLSRYPVGVKDGFVNDVVIIETSCPVGVDEALRIYMGERYVSKLDGKAVTFKVIKEAR